jgi:hypothetical protein
LQAGADEFLSDIANHPQGAERIYAKAENMMGEQEEPDLQALIAAAKGVLSE